MAAPNYSPSSGVGTTVNTGSGIYRFTGSGWEQIRSSGGGGQVLGASTGGSSGGGSPSGGYQVGGWYGGRQWDGSRLGEVGQQIVGGSNNAVPQSGDSSGPSGPSQAEIDSAFNPLFNALNTAEAGVRSGYDEDVKGVGSRYDTYSKQYEDERSRLMGEATDKQTDFNETLKSALSDAIKAYNALNQQRISRFGGGSSAGEAVGELARQEYFKQQGNVQKEGIRGEREFAKEFANIGQFIAQKKSELDMWKEEALGTLKKNLNSALANIQMQRGETESAKAQARLSIIQDSINRARAIQDQDKSFRQQLAIAGVNQLQQSSGKTFTPEEIQAYITQFMGGNTNIAPANQGVGAAVPTYNPNTGKTDDELMGLQGVV